MDSNSDIMVDLISSAIDIKAGENAITYQNMVIE